MHVYLREQRNVILDRRDFNLRRQGEGETFDDFLCSHKELAGFCDFCEHCMDDRLRDQIIVGIRDEETLKRLMEVKSVSLMQAIDICRACESAYRSAVDLRGNTAASLQRLSQYKRDQRSGTSDRPRPRTSSPGRRDSLGRDDRGRARTPSRPRCDRCGRRPHRERSLCPAIGRTCFSCGKENHFQNVCRRMSSNMSSSPASRRSPSPGSRRSRARSPQYSLHPVIADVFSSSCARPAPKIKVLFSHAGGHGTLTCMADSGADATVMGPSDARVLGIDFASL